MAGVCSYPFSLQDVVNVISPTTNDLSDCIADSDPNLFDPEYVGNKDSLFNFRNYGCGTLNLSVSGGGCSGTYIYSVISSNANNAPQVGDTIEVDMGQGGGSDTFVGDGNLYRFLYNGSTSQLVRIDSSGEITAIGSAC